MRKIFIKFLWFSCLGYILLATQVVLANQSSQYISLLKEMFTNVVVKKNVQAIPLYYDKDFLLYSNGKTMNFEQFLKFHQAIYETSIQYKISYDEQTLIEQGNNIAGRLFITTQKPNEPAQKIEVIFVAEFNGNKLYRFWELTYPDWSQMKAFQK